jgi:hypothetical protein
MPEHDPAAGMSETPGRLDEWLYFEPKHLTADDSREGEPLDHAKAKQPG